MKRICIKKRLIRLAAAAMAGYAIKKTAIPYSTRDCGIMHSIHIR